MTDIVQDGLFILSRTIFYRTDIVQENSALAFMEWSSVSALGHTNLFFISKWLA